MTSIDGSKVTAVLDRDIPTDFRDIYFDVIDSSKTKNFYGDNLNTSAGILANGPCAIRDKVKPIVKSFTATTAGIIIEFSEVVTTTASDFIISELNLMMGTDFVTVNPASVAYTDRDGVLSRPLDCPAGERTKYLKIMGLSSSKEYTVQLCPKGITTDLNGNWFVKSDIRRLTIK